MNKNNPTLIANLNVQFIASFLPLQYAYILY